MTRCLQSRMNRLFEHTGSVRELYISLQFIQNTDMDEHSCSHPLTGTRHIQACTVAINMYLGMHTLRSTAGRNASQGTARGAALVELRVSFTRPKRKKKTLLYSQ